MPFEHFFWIVTRLFKKQNLSSARSETRDNLSFAGNDISSLKRSINYSYPRHLQYYKWFFFH